MKKWIVISFLAAAAALASWQLLRVGGEAAPAASPPAPPQRATLPALADAAQPAAMRMPASSDAATEAALLATPEARAWREREQFNQRARDFFAGAAQLPATAREHEAQALETAIDSYEHSRQLSAGEAMTLRIGLVQATVADELQRADRIAALVARYEADGARREAQYAAQLQGDAGFQRYKQREAAIVAEVLVLTQIPGGLTREEYLRQRLQAERVALMQ